MKTLRGERYVLPVFIDIVGKDDKIKRYARTL